MAATANGKKREKANTTSEQTRQAGQKWSDLFRFTSKPSASFKLHKWKEAERNITQDELRNLGHCLVGYILGRFPGIQAIDQVRKSWKVDNNLSIHDSGWLIFSFKSESDRDSVLEKGPYETLGSAWVLKKMPQFFSFDDECFTLIPTWIRLHGLPLDFWSVNALGKIASFIGDPLAADECTALLTKTSFARILVEIDVTKPLKREVSFTMPNGSLFTQKIVYEREPRWCSNCRMIGHLDADCRRKLGKIPAPPAIKVPAEHRASPGDTQPQQSSAENSQLPTSQATGNMHPPPATDPLLVAPLEIEAGECSKSPTTTATKGDSPDSRKQCQTGITPHADHIFTPPMDCSKLPCTTEAGNKECQLKMGEEASSSTLPPPCTTGISAFTSPPTQLINIADDILLPMTVQTRRQKTKGKGKAR